MYSTLPIEWVFVAPLVERFIKLYTYENELILDPFMGSGTTALGAVNLNRNYIVKSILSSKLAKDKITIYKR